jgi:hypothetical protein
MFEKEKKKKSIFLIIRRSFWRLLDPKVSNNQANYKFWYCYILKNYYENMKICTYDILLKFSKY